MDTQPINPFLNSQVSAPSTDNTTTAAINPGQSGGLIGTVAHNSIYGGAMGGSQFPNYVPYIYPQQAQTINPGSALPISGGANDAFTGADIPATSGAPAVSSVPNATSAVPTIYQQNPDWLRPGESVQDWHDRVQGNSTQDNTTSSTPGSTGLSTASNIQPQTASSFFASPSATSQDVSSALQQNIATYAQAGAQTQNELDAQQALAQAVLKTQHDKMAASTAALGQYTTGAPSDIVNAQVGAINLAQSKQLEADTYAQDVAQQGLAIAQQNRQIRSTVAQQVVQDQLSMEQFSLPYSQLTAAEKISLGLQTYQLTGNSDVLPGGSSSINSGNAQTNVNNTGSTVSTIQGDNLLGYDMSSYATDPAHSQKITDILTSLPNNMMQPGQIQSYIDSKFPNSPITGQMVHDASTTSGVPPALLTSLLQEESSMGTEGAGAKTNNPGNIGNTDSGATQSFPNVAAGVQATADWLKNHFVGAPQQNAPGSATDNSNLIDSVKSFFPSSMQNGVRATVSGIPYVDLSEVPSSLQLAATNVAAQHGIKAFSGDDASGIQALNTIGQSLNQMTQLATNELLPANGGLGTAGTVIKNWWGSLSGTNPDLSDFGIYKDSAIKAVTALAGGTGSGLRLNTGTIEAAVSNLPTQNDSQEVALEKIDKTRDLLAVQMATAFGNPALANGVLQHNGHSYLPGDLVSNGSGSLGVVNADGTITPQ